MATAIQLRRGTAAEWASVNPTLRQGEPAVETDTGKLKIGDGATVWTALPYVTGSVGSLTWAAITGTPTTLAGYGVTDAATAAALAAETSARVGADSALSGRVEALETAPPAHGHSGADITSGTVPAARLPAATTSAAGVVELAASGENAPSLAVQANDPRLSDARTPTAHAHSGADITSGTVAAARLPAASTSAPGVVELATDGEVAAGVVVQGNDARLSNARPPTAHTHSAADVTSGVFDVARLPTATTTAAGAVELATGAETTPGLAVQASDPRLSDARTPTAHTHSGADITSGTVAAARLPTATTTTPGIVELATSGEVAAGVAVQGNDARLSDARTPTAHTHTIADTTGLQAALDDKADSDHTHPDYVELSAYNFDALPGKPTEGYLPTIHSHEAEDINAAPTTTLITAAGTTSVTIPALAVRVRIVAVGGGGGGGSGRLSAGGIDRWGGTGGAGGAAVDQTFRASDLRALGSSLSVTVGAGGAGAPARTSSGDGSAGTAGGETFVTVGGVRIISAPGGGAGAGGTNAANAAGAVNLAASSGLYAGPGGGSSQSGTASAGGAALLGPGGGGGGGGASSGNTYHAGGAGGTGWRLIWTTAAAAGASAAANTAVPWVGGGGGGGNASNSATAGSGGNGVRGGGGGGGGTSFTGFNSGAGGNGGDGVVYIEYTYF